MVPIPPFDETSQPPFACFFPDCCATRPTYVALMAHTNRDHNAGAADFPETHFATQFTKEKASGGTEPQQ
eukprot:7412712-Pyramimonas_sp.AAC.1